MRRTRSVDGISEGERDWSTVSLSDTDTQAYQNAFAGEYPLAERISDCELSIPMYYGLSDEEVDYIVKEINAF